ncbi:YkvI family membrane protein [Anoxybacillus eryuanensis]|uniref:YkvI family membrane protein n=1 Tax=Anoxybacillus eryuanensis TaxID=651866 RepID=UPI003EF56695
MWMRAIQIAFVYVGTVVGAGFATGKEIVQFFTQYGAIGMVMIAVSGGLFIFFGTRLMLMANRLHARSYEQLNAYLFGKVSVVVNIFMFVVLFSVTSVMLSGAGAVFEEQLHMPAYVGLLFTMAVTFVTMLFGLNGILSVNMVVVPLMIIFSFAISLMNGSDLVWTKPPFAAFFSPFAYVAFNLAMAQVVLVPLATEVKDERTIRLGGWLGGILLMGILFSSHLALSLLPDLQSYSIPMAEVVKRSLASFYGLYVVIIYGEIFTSFIAGVFGLHRKLALFFRTPIFVLIALLMAMYAFSLVGYHSLLTLLYPLFGYMSIIFIFLLFYRKMPS